MTLREVSGALRVMFAVTPTRRELRWAFFTNVALKRDGSTAYRLDDELRISRLVRELESADASHSPLCVM